MEDKDLNEPFSCAEYENPRYFCNFKNFRKFLIFSFPCFTNLFVAFRHYTAGSLLLTSFRCLFPDPLSAIQSSFRGNIKKKCYVDEALLQFEFMAYLNNFHEYFLDLCEVHTLCTKFVNIMVAK